MRRTELVREDSGRATPVRECLFSVDIGGDVALIYPLRPPLDSDNEWPTAHRQDPLTRSQYVLIVSVYHFIAWFVTHCHRITPPPPRDNIHFRCVCYSVWDVIVLYLEPCACIFVCVKEIATQYVQYSQSII